MFKGREKPNKAVIEGILSINPRGGGYIQKCFGTITTHIKNIETIQKLI